MRPRRAWCGGLAVLTTAALTAPLAGSATGAELPVSTAAAAAGPARDIREVPDVAKLRFRDENGNAVSRPTFERRLAASARSAQSAATAADGETPVGTERLWVAIDFETGFAYLKNFVLRQVGEHIEVWTAEGVQGSPEQPETNDLDFLDGDCRNGVRTTVTDEQVDYLVDEFDNNIYPIESEVFSTPPDRDGSGQQLGDDFDFTGGGDNIVTLVDNVRDDNFYDLNNTEGNTYVAGFFSSGINELVDRNVMTIDGFDWLHRTGANPPDEPTTDLCTNAPARPFLYEGVFAHEYQHLLESYEDADEVNWVNEGLSDYAQTITGYADPSLTVFQPGYDSHVQCFLGYLILRSPFNSIPREQCGPSNSLTMWGDQGDDNILADYGAAYTMMEFLAGRYGHDFLTALHRDDDSGFVGLQNVLDEFAPGTQAMDVLHDWAVMVALDAPIDRGGMLMGADPERFTTPSLFSSILWYNPEAYESASEAPENREGAPPNGSDYVRLRDENGRFVTARQVDTLSFHGAQTLDPKEVEWTVDENPEGHDSAALYSGTGDNFDRSIARQVSVPADDATLTFDTRWSTEPDFDSGFVQISTDGETWTSLGNEDTVDELSPGADPNLTDNLPGLNGEGGWKSTSFDLSAYAGQDVWLAFRYVSDANTNGEGWWVDNVMVGDTLISDGTTLEGWQTYTQIDPVPVAGFTVQVVGFNNYPRNSPVVYATMDLDESFSGTLDMGELLEGVEGDLKFIGAIVTYDDPTETSDSYAPYTLEADGVVQRGGGR